jgi:SAM-dependent methyltransferase
LPGEPLQQQQDQPDGVPPLALDGERTLPDIPAENYWFQRHLAAYEWVRARVAALRVVDMGSGEGYGSDVLARTADAVVGVDANPQAFEHARLRYVKPNLRFERELIENYHELCDVIAFMQTVEHIRDPAPLLEQFKSMLVDGARSAVYITTPNVITLAGGKQHSGNPWHVREYRPDEFRSLCEQHFTRVEIHGVFAAGRLAAHELAVEKLGWDHIQKRLGITDQFYGAFLPSLTVRDFDVRQSDYLGRALDLIAVCRP